MVKYIREYIESQMGSFVDEEIEQSSFPNKLSQQKSLIETVTEKAVDSKLYEYAIFYF